MADKERTIKALQDFIEKDRDFVINLTCDLVRIPSVNPKFETADGLNREGDVQTLLEPILNDEGFATEQFDALPGRPNLIGEKPGSEEKSLILCDWLRKNPITIEWELGGLHPAGSPARLIALPIELLNGPSAFTARKFPLPGYAFKHWRELVLTSFRRFSR